MLAPVRFGRRRLHQACTPAPSDGRRAAGTWLTLVLAVAGCTTAQPPAPAEKSVSAPQDGALAKQGELAKQVGEDWVRVSRDAEGNPLAMQVAVVRYAGAWGGRQVAVDLVGAVHVGDAAYYRTLNQRFTRYDALLYELVAPAGKVVDPQQFQKSRGPLTALQNGLCSLLGLEHQLANVDYRKPNFVHADMTPEEFRQSMAERGESVLSMLFQIMGQGIAAQAGEASQGKSSDLDLLVALFSPNRQQRLRIICAEQLAEIESILGGFGGESGSTIITERNKAALRVLRRELDDGKTELAIFYGAGHLPDMHDRLREEFKLQPAKITWIDAWRLDG